MQIINAVLLFLALILIWGTLNLDRSANRIVETDQSTQLNDSIEFLRKLKRKSAREESLGRRMEAYRKTVEQALKENPDYLKDIEENFGKGTQACESLLDNLMSSTVKINSDLTHVNEAVQKVRESDNADSITTVSHLRELFQAISEIESASSDVEGYSANLNQQISEVKAGVIF
ncbi:MAG: hypothetical protein QGI21_06805 [Candidatus Poseidoniaceae archaeon]|jgi:ABC-type transporter Mla subunit MlaD|nr:hypothetical protein [Candidatus Poseidoniaceae archaeon]